MHMCTSLASGIILETNNHVTNLCSMPSMHVLAVSPNLRSRTEYKHGLNESNIVGLDQVK
jgi:hypothetical protein